MKTRRIAQMLCSLIVVVLTSNASAAPAEADPVGSTSEDPIGEWIEKNADRFGLYVDKAARPKDAGARPKVAAPNRQVPTSGRAVSPQTAASAASAVAPSAHPPVVTPLPPTSAASAASAAASSPSASASAPAESDPIQAFIINRVIDLPKSTGGPGPFSIVPMNEGSGTMTTNPGGFPSVLNGPGANLNLGAPDSASDLTLSVDTPVSDLVIERKSFAPPVDAAKASNAAAQITAVMKDLDFGDKCKGFATTTGFGAWGKTVIQELVGGNANSLLQGTDDLRRACPNYDFLTIPQKSHVWVNVLASMSFLESSCDPKVVGKGPDGKAAGLLQLHAGFEHRAAPGCNRNDSRSPITSLQCTISIIETQIKRTSSLFSRDTHFGVLRPQGDLVRTRNGALKRIVKARVVVGGIKELPFCQRK